MSARPRRDAKKAIGRLAAQLESKHWRVVLWSYAASHSTAEVALGAPWTHTLHAVGVETLRFKATDDSTRIRVEQRDGLVVLKAKGLRIEARALTLRPGPPSPIVDPRWLEALVRRGPSGMPTGW